jgi:hypothetical protein
MESRVTRHIFASTAAEVIHYGDLPAFPEAVFGQMAANESRAAGNQKFHRPRLVQTHPCLHPTTRLRNSLQHSSRRGLKRQKTGAFRRGSRATAGAFGLNEKSGFSSWIVHWA